MKYVKKPVVIEAIQWKGTNTEKMSNFFQSFAGWGYDADNKIEIQTLEGTMYADVNDFIIKGVKGEFYPCKPDIFEMSYSPVADDFKSRLIEEQAQLEEKLNKLNDFNGSEKAKEITPVMQDLLIIQAGAMYTYNEVLRMRLSML